jgi:hypothetical protein
MEQVKLGEGAGAALRAAVRATALVPSHPRSHFAVGQLLRDLKEWPSALASLDRSLKLEPEGNRGQIARYAPLSWPARLLHLFAVDKAGIVPVVIKAWMLKQLIALLSDIIKAAPELSSRLQGACSTECLLLQDGTAVTCTASGMRSDTCQPRECAQLGGEDECGARHWQH